MTGKVFKLCWCYRDGKCGGHGWLDDRGDSGCGNLTIGIRELKCWGVVSKELSAGVGGIRRWSSYEASSCMIMKAYCPGSCSVGGSHTNADPSNKAANALVSSATEAPEDELSMREDYLQLYPLSSYHFAIWLGA